MNGLWVSPKARAPFPCQGSLRVMFTCKVVSAAAMQEDQAKASSGPVLFPEPCQGGREVQPRVTVDFPLCTILLRCCHLPIPPLGKSKLGAMSASCPPDLRWAIQLLRTELGLSNTSALNPCTIFATTSLQVLELRHPCLPHSCTSSSRKPSQAGMTHHDSSGPHQLFPGHPETGHPEPGDLNPLAKGLPMQGARAHGDTGKGIP